MSERIGLFGGSFNPIHHGHLIIARAVAEALRLDRVILLPSANPPHKRDDSLAPAHDRAKMVRLAIDGDPLFEMSDYDLTRTGPSYTVDTVAHFRSLFGPDAELFWIIGADSLAELTSWRDVPRILDMCEVATASRSLTEAVDWDSLHAKLGAERAERLKRHLISTPTIDISSTELRARAAAGQSIRYLAPDAVLAYIGTYDLYRDSRRP